jgi:hypothetical protein
MTGTLALLAVGAFVALVGRTAAHLLPASAGHASLESDSLALASGLEASVLRSLLGFGIVSLGLFGLVSCDCFTGWGLGIAVAVPVGLALAQHLRAPALALPALGRDLAVGLSLALLALAYGWLQPAYDLTIAGSDGSVYLAAARKLATDGQLQHTDAVVAEMTAAERRLLFEQTSEGRLPGGILLADGASGRVSFSFYHLLPAWLALGLRTMGRAGDLRILSLFPVLSLCASFLLGRRLGGRALALAFCVAQLCFLPQAYFSRFPSSEILAQALFLAGLAFLVCRLGRDAPVRLQDAAAAGVLWGALCLSRVDSIPFLCIGLTLAAFACRRSGFGASSWLVAVAWVGACSAVAVHHQLANGSYLFLPAMAFLSGRMSAAAPGLITQPWGRLVVLTIAATIVAASHRNGRAAAERLRLFWAARALLVLPTVAILAHFASQWYWPGVARRIVWMTLYATPVGLGVLCAGLVFGSWRWLRSTAEPGARLGLALLAGPACCYLLNPMVTATQPWAVRRFVPMVFPLFLLLSLLGWRALTTRLCGDRPRVAFVAQAGLVFGITVTFLLHSARVVLPGGAVREPLRELGLRIPEHSLVLMSDRDAWLHLQTALQYVLRYDTLLLPLSGGSDPRDDLVVSGYLGRQVAKGRRLMLVLAQDETGAGSLLRRYGLRFRGSGSLAYVRLPFAFGERFPSGIGRGRLRYRVYELQSAARPPAWHEIQIGDVEQDAAVVLEGFYAAERDGGEEGGRPFRWTGPVARLALPPVEEVRLALDTRRPAFAPAAQLDVDVDGVPVAGIHDEHQGRQCLRLRFPKDPVAVNRIVTLSTNTFEPSALQGAVRERRLGVRVFSVSIGGPSASTATEPHDESCGSSQEPSAAGQAAGATRVGAPLRAGMRTKASP